MGTITTGNVPKALSGGGDMARLTTRGRKAIASGSFALPGRRYPIEDASHARNALARVSQHGSPGEQSTVRRKVAARYPGISQAHHNDGGMAHHADGGSAHR